MKQFAIIAGSGFRSFAANSEIKIIDTDFGKPSGPLRKIELTGHAVYFLPRHGDDLFIPPHAINYRANMKALKQLSVEQIISINTVGVIAEKQHPGQIAIPDQLIDYSWGRAHSYFDGSGKIDHIDFTHPFSANLRNQLLVAADNADVAVHDGGVYAVTQGPRLESAVEVDRLCRDGADYVGMTAMPEASLARELGMDYACLSLIVNYAAGRGQTPIHEDLVVGTKKAKASALALVESFFLNLK